MNGYFCASVAITLEVKRKSKMVNGIGFLIFTVHGISSATIIRIPRPTYNTGKHGDACFARNCLFGLLYQVSFDV